jgi:hypothetical protein
VLTVNFSSVRDGLPHDASCVVEAGCHPFIRHRSFVFYDKAVVLNADRLETALRQNAIRLHDPVSDELFEQIRVGLNQTPYLRPRIRRFARNCVPFLLNP